MIFTSSIMLAFLSCATCFAAGCIVGGAYLFYWMRAESHRRMFDVAADTRARLFTGRGV